MTFAERQALRKQAIAELNRGNLKEYENIMRKAREAIPDYKVPDQEVWGSDNAKVIKRRKRVKRLLEAGYDNKEIIAMCGTSNATIWKDIRILREMGTIKVDE
ncbi:hypothetical protein [Pediococcus pentosaceus]|uniref:hypothetical protein n=1 Tax=Pediococcus pentosaceus TaxID=1255 RepID=UPI000C08A308|nr:hypothetical protein [Pediococcus pentosaceus]MCT1178722.1 hypothetical protein [Pediococcus pentosaceus]